MNYTPAKTHAFTLLELLVVLATIAVLAALMLPALANTRNNVKPAGCQSNLRQWATATQLYAADNGDQIPTDGMGANGVWGPGSPLPTGTPDDTNAWFNLLPQYAGEQRFTTFYHTPGGDPRLKYPFPGNNIGKIWMCPAAAMDQAGYNALADGGVYGFFSYNFNIDLKGSAHGLFPYPLMPHLGSLPKPAATVLMLDDAFNPLTEVVNGSPSFNSENPACRYKTVSIRHDLGAFIAFCDGHVARFSTYYVTNNPTQPSEPQQPDIIWDWSNR